MASVKHARHATGIELMREVRIGFIRQGSTLGTWCKANSVNPSAARQAIIGTWAGQKGQAILKRILNAAGIDTKAAA